MTQAAFTDATELAYALSQRHISAVEIVKIYLERIDRYNPLLGAIATVNTEGALARAAAADDALSRGTLWGPLHGVPITLEDCHATAGVRSTWGGFPPLEDHVPEVDGAVCERLLKAGAILLGKSYGPVMWADSPFKRPNNPWDLRRTTGGSASGPAAAVAAGLTGFDVALDTTGSLQRPAHNCGIFGMRPTEHRVPLTGAFFIDPIRKFRAMSVVGPLTRSIRDLNLILPIVCGPDGADSLVPPVPWRHAKIELNRLRIAWSPSVPGMIIENRISAAVESLARKAALLGAKVTQALPDIDFGEQLGLASHLFDLMSDAFSGARSEAAEDSLDAFLFALAQRDDYIREWEEFLHPYDVLLCPLYGDTAPFHDADSVEINGVKLTPEEEPHRFLPHAIGPVTGCPVVVMPLGQDPLGLPFGVQLVGRRWSDELLIAIAGHLSNLCCGYEIPPAFVA